MLPEELSTQKHDGNNCFKFGSLKEKEQNRRVFFRLGARMDPK